MMNNTAHVLQFLDYVPTAAQFEKHLDDMRNGAEGLDVTRSSDTLYNILNCAKDDMLNKLDRIIMHVGSRVSSFLFLCYLDQGLIYIGGLEPEPLDVDTFTILTNSVRDG